MVEQSGGDGEKWRWWGKVEVMGKSGGGFVKSGGVCECEVFG